MPRHTVNVRGRWVQTIRGTVAHKFINMDHSGNIEFCCGHGRHLDEVRVPDLNVKCCRLCVAYLKNDKRRRCIKRESDPLVPKPKLLIDMSEVDFELLARQKAKLIGLRSRHHLKGGMPNSVLDSLDGLIALLDEIQDQAEAQNWSNA